MSFTPASTGNGRLILGTMTFGPDVETGARVTSLDDYKSTLDLFQSKGYHEIDTARAYIAGKQEGWTRDAGWKERGLKLATKCYPRDGGEHKPANLRASLETSLKELGTDRVDIFYLHAADRTVNFEETLEECNKLHKEGKFVELGLSNFTAFEVAEVVILCRERGWVRPTIYQGMYNAITRAPEAELYPALRRYGFQIVVYNPLAGGLFSGKYSAKDLEQVPQEGRYSDQSWSGKMYRQRYFRDATFQALAIIEPVVKKHNLSLIEVALRWLVHHSLLEIGPNKPDGVIIGVSSKSQLQGNMEGFEGGPLPDEVLKALDEAWAVAKADTTPYWHGTVEYKYDTRKALFGV